MSKSRIGIDREIMYRKIMPFTPKRGVKIAQADTGNSGAGQSDTALCGHVSGGKGVTGMSALSAPSVAAIAETLKHSSVTFPFKEENNTVLVNLMEELVINKLEPTLDRFNCCKCDKYKKDIAALALSHLRPRHVAMKEEEQEKHRKTGLGNGFEVTEVLVQTILVVKKTLWH